jgi:FlaA1/EpsC-like NDP-sugar epimerase
VAEVGDIRDPRHIDEVIRRYGVQLIFHAAAYKHVPLMEAQVLEAVNNNVIGTWNLVAAAKRHGVSHFIMISSDKAVNPSSVMGATKRITELIVSAISASGGRTNFVCVRFGNVLGSNGSVIPLFQAQIAAGGPVTVTHPDIRRYFMTAREAAQLVLQASAMGQRGDIFILDMGEPIRLVGLEPDEEIGIRFTGLRPGEKLFEELSREDEQLQPTSHDKIQVCKGPVLELRTIEESISEMRESLERRDHVSVMSQIAFLVPEYQPGKDGVGLTAVRRGVRSLPVERHNTAMA